jgi:hypothetical protein
MNEICDQINCLLHSSSIQEKKESEKTIQARDSSHNHTYQAYSPNSWAQATANVAVTWTSGVPADSNFDLNTRAFEVPKDDNKSIMIINLSKELRVPIECLFCIHMKKLDMEKEVWAMRAKNKLLEK